MNKAVGETARVQTILSGEDDFFWIEIVLNGINLDCPIRVGSIHSGERIAEQINNLVKEVYRRAYRKGFATCQLNIQNAIGLHLKSLTGKEAE